MLPRPCGGAAPIMKKLVIAFLFVLSIPAGVGAHAVPLDSSPASSAVLPESPHQVEIRFSERIDVEASRITVTGPSGAVISDNRAQIVSGDPYRIAVPVRDDGEGAYVVEWSVVSQDDGHFTKGAYLFAAGEGITLDASQGSDTRIVQIATLPEIFGMTVELFGHGLLWAVLVLFALVIRPLLVSGRFLGLKDLFVSAYGFLAGLATVLAISGAVFQIWFKTKDLAALHAGTVYEALPMYLSTVAGSATMYRIAAATLFILVVLMFRRIIVESKRFTWQEGALVAILAVFAFFRAKVSHATANHFFPDFSVAVNFIHLVEKDIWAGLLAILFLALFFSRTRELYAVILGRTFTLLTVNLAAVAVTASYITWLHLKDFGNLFTTQWGSNFLELLLVALLLVGVRTYHTLTHTYRIKVFQRMLPLTLAAELALAIMVIYASSAVIITSPPPEEPATPIFISSSEGARITFEKNRYVDGMMRIGIETGSSHETPAVTLTDEAGSTVEIEVTQDYPGSYVLPAALVQSDETQTLSIRVPQAGAYDATATFSIPKGAYLDATYREGHRPFNLFTIVFIVISIVGLISVLVLFRFSRRAEGLSINTGGTYRDLLALGGAVATMAVVAALVAMLNNSPIQNPYKTRCESDGNMWHVMLPSKAGVPLSRTPREGCMWGMGAYQYMFPERAEYEYYASLPKAIASVDFDSQPIAGQKASFTVSIHESDGTPATLFVDMERLVHVVIVSKDQTVFAHMHPDDARVLTEEEQGSATFSLSYVFPKSGEYLMSIDYANGITLESGQFPIVVKGKTAQDTHARTYASPARVGDFDVALKYSQPVAGDVSTLVYTISKNGASAELEPYLSAAMHIAVVKNDFSAFAHVHGEVHPPNTTLPPIIVKDGKIVHAMASLITPAKFSYPIDVHVIFPTPGLYTLWGQFQSDGVVYAVPLSVRVEE